MGFQFLEHTADAKIKVEEKTLSKAFSTAALAMKEVIAEQILVAPKIKKDFIIEAENKEALLYTFLEEFLYLLDTKRFVLSKAPLVKITEKNNKLILEAKAIGDDISKYLVTNKVKAITYNDMKIEEKEDKVTMIFVIDI